MIFSCYKVIYIHTHTHLTIAKANSTLVHIGTPPDGRAPQKITQPTRLRWYRFKNQLNMGWIIEDRRGCHHTLPTTRLGSRVHSQAEQRVSTTLTRGSATHPDR
jgi:hypothetical protein